MMPLHPIILIYCYLHNYLLLLKQVSVLYFTTPVKGGINESIDILHVMLTVGFFYTCWIIRQWNIHDNNEIILIIFAQGNR